MIEQISVPPSIQLISWPGECEAVAFDERNGQTHLLDEFSAMLLLKLWCSPSTRMQLHTALVDTRDSKLIEVPEHALLFAVDYLQDRGLIESHWIEESC